MSVGAVAAVRRAERRLVQRLREAGATSASRAVEMPELRWIEARRLRRFVARGVIGEAAPGRFYLDEARYEVHRGQRRRLRVVLLGGITLVAIGVFWYTNFR